MFMELFWKRQFICPESTIKLYNFCVSDRGWFFILKKIGDDFFLIFGFKESVQVIDQFGKRREVLVIGFSICYS